VVDAAVVVPPKAPNEPKPPVVPAVEPKVVPVVPVVDDPKAGCVDPNIPVVPDVPVPKLGAVEDGELVVVEPNAMAGILLLLVNGIPASPPDKELVVPAVLAPPNIFELNDPLVPPVPPLPAEAPNPVVPNPPNPLEAAGFAAVENIATDRESGAELWRKKL